MRGCRGDSIIDAQGFSPENSAVLSSPDQNHKLAFPGRQACAYLPVSVVVVAAVVVLVAAFISFVAAVLLALFAALLFLFAHFPVVFMV